MTRDRHAYLLRESARGPLTQVEVQELLDAVEQSFGAVVQERRNIAAYMLDRADQYETSSGSWVALADVCGAVMGGEAEEAAKCGELDDIYRRVDRMKAHEDEVRARKASR